MCTKNKSSGNVFEDMGFADAEERLAKAKTEPRINVAYV